MLSVVVPFTPEIACRRAKAYCSSVNHFCFIPDLPSNANQGLVDSDSPQSREREEARFQERQLTTTSSRR